jgi:hypothetical protein
MKQVRAATAPEHEPAEGPLSLTGLADDSQASAFDRALQWIPRALASKPHIVLLILLGVYLIALPLFGIMVSQRAELIGGNYTNVTSDIGACIAAGGTLHLIRQTRKRARIDRERLRLLEDIHSLLHHVHKDAATELGHVLPTPERPPQASPPADTD